MNIENSREDREQEKRQAKIQEGNKNSGVNSNSRSMGDATRTRSEAWNNEIGISREASQRRNLPRSSFGGEIFGGTISQLIAKAEDQLAVLEKSAEETKKYISDLKEILELIKKNQ